MVINKEQYYAGTLEQGTLGQTWFVSVFKVYNDDKQYSVLFTIDGAV